MRIMNPSFPPKTMVAASLVVLTLAALSGSPAVSSASVLIFTAVAIVAATMVFLSRRGLPATVAEVLHTVESTPASKDGADIGDPSVERRERTAKDIVIRSAIGLLMAPAACIVFTAQGADAQDLSRYREFQLGATVTAIAAQIEVTPSDVKMLHQRPAVIQEVEWRPRGTFVGGVSNRDSVREAVFSFYDDQLFRIVVAYEREQTEGLTDADLIEAISATYGPPAVRRRATIATSPLSSAYSDAESVIGQWDNAEYALTLFRSAAQSSVGMVIASKRTEPLARAAILRAERLDAQEAPQREAARQKQQNSDDRATKEKARTANKGTFRP